MNYIKIIKQVKIVWKKTIVFVMQNLFLLIFDICAVYFSIGLNFFAKSLVYFAIGASLCNIIVNNTEIVLIINQYFPRKRVMKFHRHSPEIGCTICGDSHCTKESNTLQEPWKNLKLDSRLDSAIQKFFDTIINEYVITWHSMHSDNIELIDGLRLSLKYAASNLYKRIQNVHLGKLIMRKLVPCGLHHFDVFYYMKQNLSDNKTLEEFLLASPYTRELHAAVANRESELQHLRDVTTTIMPLLLQKEDFENRFSRTIIRELFAGWVLLPLLDLLANPEIVNVLLMLLTDGEKMEEIKDEPFTKVEFLYEFVNDGPKDYHNNKILKLSVEDILLEPKNLYAFMQFMKKKGQVHILQFCLDIDEFNGKMLSPELNRDELVNLYKRAKDIYNTYFDVESPSALNFNDEWAMDMQNILNGGSSQIIQLQTSEALFEAYEYAYNLLENVWAPKFYHSKEFYSVKFKPVPSDPIPCPKTPQTVVKYKSKIKDAVKFRTLDGRILNFSDGLSIYLDTILENDLNNDTDLFKVFGKMLYPSKMNENDMSTWEITIQEIYLTQMDWESDYIYVIVIKSSYENDYCNWVVERKEIDFHTLQEKLIEFHGEQIISSSRLPSDRVGISNNYKKIMYEEFLQNLVKSESLRTSGLVCLFLTTDEDFTFVAREEISADFSSVASATLRNKREYLSPFLDKLLKSVGVEDTPTMDGDEKPKEETEKPKEPLTTKDLKTNPRVITDEIFKNNFNVQEFSDHPLKCEIYETHSFDKQIKGFSAIMDYLATKVFKLSSYIYSMVFTFVNTFKEIIDIYVENYVGDFICSIFCQARLAHLINLGYDLIFTDKKLLHKMTPEEGKMKVKEQLRARIPNILVSMTGDASFVPIDGAIDLVQSPQLNKQLVLSLFDIVVIELFPEMAEKATDIMNESNGI